MYQKLYRWLSKTAKITIYRVCKITGFKNDAVHTVNTHTHTPAAIAAARAATGGPGRPSGA